MRLLLCFVLAPYLWAQSIDLNGDQIRGTLPVTRGGTGQTSAAGALAALGGIGASTTDTLTNKTILGAKYDQLRDTANNLPVLSISGVSGAVNYLTLQNNVTGQAPSLEATGSDTNIGINLVPKGTGQLILPAVDYWQIAGSGSNPGYVLTAQGSGVPVWAPAGGGGGAPTTATYITQTPDAGLSAEQALSLLSTGIVKVTTGTGVLSVAVGADLPLHQSRHGIAGDDPVTIAGEQITSGTIGNDYLPSSMPGKTFTSGVFLSGFSGDNYIRFNEQYTDPSCPAASTTLTVSANGLRYCKSAGSWQPLIVVSGSPAGKLAYFLSNDVVQGQDWSVNADPATVAMRDAGGNLTATVFYGNLTGTVSGNVIGNALTATSLDHNPTNCPAGQYVYDVDSGVALQCSQVALSTTTGTLDLNKGGTNQTSWIAGRCVQVNAGGTALEPATGACGTGGGSGTVTSVGLSMPGEFGVTGSPVTTAGTLTATWNSQSANLVFAGPTGGSATPAFRLLAAGDIPSLDTSKLTTGLLPLARGGTNQGTWIASRCVQVNAGGTALEPAASGCGAGGGITGPGTTSIGHVPLWADTGGTSLAAGYPAVVGPTGAASAFVLRDSNGGAGVWDKGGQVYNCKAYGATGDGVTDDRAAIQACIDAVPATGGVAFLPAGDYLINSTHGTYSGCGLVLGNGTDSAYSSVNNIVLEGVGQGVGTGVSSSANAQRGATRLKAGATSGNTRMVCVHGPVVNWGIKHLLINNAGYVSGGILNHHGAQGIIEDVGITNWSGWALHMSTKTRPADDSSPAFFACGNTVRHFFTYDVSSTVASGIWLDGNFEIVDSDPGPGVTLVPAVFSSCANWFERIGVNFGSDASAIGLYLTEADNNKFVSSGFNSYTPGSGSPGSGKPIVFHQTNADNATYGLFPYGNKFIAVDSNHGTMYYQTVVNLNYLGGNHVELHTRQEGNATPNIARTYVTTDDGRGIWNAQVDATTGDAPFRFRDPYGTDIFSFKRSAIGSENGLEITSFDEIILSSSATRISSNGSAASLPSSLAGSILWCADCGLNANTYPTSNCQGSGTGAFAFRVNSTWRCFQF